MSKIVISGYYGFANAGDEAMLTAIIESLRSTEELTELTVISGNPKVTAAKHHVASVHRFNPFEILPAVYHSDLLLSGGGSLLQDITSKKSLLYYLTILALGKVFGKKVMLFAQGIGPIKSGVMRKLTKFICSGVDLITVRDTDSVQELKRIGVPIEKVRLTADSVLTLPRGDKNYGRKLLHRFNVPDDKMLIAVSVRKWNCGGNYLQELAKAANVLADKYNAHIVLLPLQYPDDVAVCKKVQQYMVEGNGQRDVSTVLDFAYDTEQFLALMGNFSLMVGMRLHALIFAAVMSVPFAALSYDPKINSFVKEVAGVNAGSIDDFSAENVIEAADAALATDNGSRQRLEKLREKARLNSQMAFDLLHN